MPSAPPSSALVSEMAAADPARSAGALLTTSVARTTVGQIPRE